MKSRDSTILTNFKSLETKEKQLALQRASMPEVHGSNHKAMILPSIFRNFLETISSRMLRCGVELPLRIKCVPSILTGTFLGSSK
jgi:hypothetical protein